MEKSINTVKVRHFLEWCLTHKAGAPRLNKGGSVLPEAWNDYCKRTGYAEVLPGQCDYLTEVPENFL